MKKFDIIISGGGMIGSIAAVAATRAGLSVLLIEANENQQFDKESERELRVSAISWDNCEYLKLLGIFSNLISSRIQSYAHMSVWDNRSNGKISFEADYSQQKYLGCLMENKNLIHGAWKALKSTDNCQIIEQSHIKNIENPGQQIRIELNDGSLYKSKLLIAAEGRNSFIRQYAEIKTSGYDYKQKGLVAYIKLESAKPETAFQSFNDGGPIGILPIDDCLYSIVWSLPLEQCNDWLTCTEEDFELGLKKAIGKDFGKIKLMSQRAAFPLTQLYAEKYFDNRIVLCGDSAHGVHPLAGQGVNLGIGDIQSLFQLLNKDILKDDEILHLKLRKYQRRRISKVKETSEMMSFMHHLFVDDKHIKNPLRGFGLNVLDKIPLKKWFISQAGS